ncbi:MAG: cytochrome c [Bacteroidia bacterium]
MKRLLKWTVISLASLLAFTLLAIGTVYALSNHAIKQQYEYTLSDFSVVSDSSLIVEGNRLAKIHGCSNGCHGPDAKGQVWIDRPGIKVTTPNLPRIFSDFTDAELERSIRGGVKADGSSTLIMPSSEYYYFSDYDLSAIIAYFRSLPPEASEGPEADFTLGWKPRLELIQGEFKVEAEKIATYPARIASIDTTDLHQFGHYITATSCGGCHGHDLMGGSIGSGPTPSLKIVAAYSEAEFDRFMTSGIAKGERETRMSNKARKSFSHLTPNELDALYTYLSDFAKTPMASNKGD